LRKPRNFPIVLPPGATSLGINLDALCPPPAPLPDPDGDTIAEFTVYHRPVPWKAPTVTRKGAVFKDGSLLAWQEHVRKAAREAMVGRDPYKGQVGLVLAFTLSDVPNRAYGDTSNLSKSTEDSLQKIVIANDKQVARIEATRVIGGRDSARIRVYKLKETG